MSGYLDGNAAAGALSEVFVGDITTALGRCAHCGRTGAMATTRCYLDPHGLVLRCPGCAEVLLRLVEGDGQLRLDLRGVSFLTLTRP
ncbi:DUF6510 family protein [Cryobacterium sp. PAMC25264]|uniref:DUF6510 family protein n=1 Tax=Cryobacterium sp. PAMC25264 TaxID=2861288 RepID=UPI001C62A6CC|nr:DUF6510 family protein [Cryobacterium sp. PAMC25264]QYF72209.1 hypothetical protein KY500_10060 [Cryobacterium sp. PAMC25264]